MPPLAHIILPIFLKGTFAPLLFAFFLSSFTPLHTPTHLRVYGPPFLFPRQTSSFSLSTGKDFYFSVSTKRRKARLSFFVDFRLADSSAVVNFDAIKLFLHYNIVIISQDTFIVNSKNCLFCCQNLLFGVFFGFWWIFFEQGTFLDF